MPICFLCYSIYLFAKFHWESVYSTDSYNETFYFKDGFGCYNCYKCYNCYAASTLPTHSISGDLFSGKSSLKMFCLGMRGRRGRPYSLGTEEASTNKHSKRRIKKRQTFHNKMEDDCELL